MGPQEWSYEQCIPRLWSEVLHLFWRMYRCPNIIKGQSRSTEIVEYWYGLTQLLCTLFWYSTKSLCFATWTKITWITISPVGSLIYIYICSQAYLTFVFMLVIRFTTIRRSNDVINMNTNMPSYQYINFNYKDETVSWPSYLCIGNPYIWKDGLYIDTEPSFPLRIWFRISYWDYKADS